MPRLSHEPNAYLLYISRWHALRRVSPRCRGPADKRVACTKSGLPAASALPYANSNVSTHPPLRCPPVVGDNPEGRTKGSSCVPGTLWILSVSLVDLAPAVAHSQWNIGRPEKISRSREHAARPLKPDPSTVTDESRVIGTHPRTLTHDPRGARLTQETMG